MNARFGPRKAVSLVAGAVIELCLAAIVTLPGLRGPPLIQFWAFFLMAAAAYIVSVIWLGRATLSTRAIWAFALLFRVTILLSGPPTLSDDVYRYIWDGRLVNAGVNPYSHSVDSPRLDRFDTPQRALVNNAWMASPYLPAAQGLFASVYRLAPDSTFAFQVAAVFFDLLTGWLLFDLLRRLNLPPERALIYLWNPLVIVEFAHGAHVDALMSCLMMAALWALMADRSRISPFLSPLALAAATLTKGVPALVVPVVMWRWGWRRALLYIGTLVAALVPFALGSGWGLTGPRDGEGLFGALRIYAARWNFNGGLYHWLEVALSGYRTPGAVPPEIVGEAPIRTAKLIVALLMDLVLIATAWQARRRSDGLALMRLTTVPLGAYLVLTTTVHAWYVTVILPFLPFLYPRKGDACAWGRFLWPWLYFSAAVVLSYLTYLDPANLREYDRVRLLEYVPLYGLLIWAAWRANGAARDSGVD